MGQPERLRLDLERFAESSKADEVRALGAVIEEVNQWPDVRQAFKDAFALLRQRKNGGAANERPAEDQMQPDQSESNQIKPDEPDTPAKLEFPSQFYRFHVTHVRHLHHATGVLRDPLFLKLVAMTYGEVDCASRPFGRQFSAVKHSWSKRDLFLLTLLGVAGAAGLFFFTHPAPPAQHNGRDAYEWAIRLTWPPDQKSKDEATTALRALGTNALPLLRQRLAERESLPRQVRVWLGERLPGHMGRAFTKNLKPVSYASIRSTAAQGLKVLATNAAPAVPDLILAMRDPDRDVMWSAATALGESGGTGALALIPLLNDPDYNVRHATAYALGQIGPPALAAAPTLVQRLGEKNEAVRSSAYYSLSRIGAVAGPTVLKLVHESHGEDRRNAAKALVAVHPRGQLTLPVLLEMAHDHDAASRAVAIESLMGLRITHSNAMAVYIAGLADTNPAVRLAAANALAQAVHKASNATNALAALEENDPDEVVRFAASVALEKIAAFLTPQTNSP